MPANPPAVSVLIGAYDNEETLARAIESILAQTERDIEVIVIDDGSRDASATVAERAVAEDPRCELMHLNRNLGIAASLNEGLARVRAPIVAIQDADDFSVPHRLERQLAALAVDPEVVVVGARMREVDPAGRELRPRTSFAAGDVGPVLMRFNPIPNGISAFRLEAIREVGGYDPRYRYAPEYDLWIRLAERHRLVALDEVLATRVMGDANVAARAERAQTREAIAIRARAMRRRRSARGATGLARPIASYLTPTPLKRAVRRRRGQAP